MSEIKEGLKTEWYENGKKKCQNIHNKILD